LTFKNDDIEKIIVNKLLLHKKNETIDIRSMVTILGQGKFNGSAFMSSCEFSENDILLFKDFGIIETQKHYVNMPGLWGFNLLYDTAVIKFNKDKLFSIEIDFTFIYQDGREVKENILANFERYKYTENYTFWAILGWFLH
jgi:hypothetical protein